MTRSGYKLEVDLAYRQTDAGAAELVHTERRQIGYANTFVRPAAVLSMVADEIDGMAQPSAAQPEVTSEKNTKKPRSQKKTSVSTEALMRELIAKNPETVSWNVRRFATAISRSVGSVGECPAWKELQLVREMKRVSAVEVWEQAISRRQSRSRPRLNT